MILNLKYRKKIEFFEKKKQRSNRKTQQNYHQKFKTAETKNLATNITNKLTLDFDNRKNYPSNAAKRLLNHVLQSQFC